MNDEIIDVIISLMDICEEHYDGYSSSDEILRADDLLKKLEKENGKCASCGGNIYGTIRIHHHTDENDKDITGF